MVDELMGHIKQSTHLPIHSSTHLPETIRIGITMGDPAGIGPEVVIRALARLRSPHRFVVFGDAQWLAATRRAVKLPIHAFPGPRVTIQNCCNVTGKHIRRGQPSVATGQAAFDALRAAMRALEAGVIDALVTAPVSKATVQSAGHWFPGHTEWLAREAGVRDVEMLLVGGGLRILPLTRHVPLRRVPRLITRARLRTALRVCATALRQQFGIRRPRIAVAGLNPHAGESGTVGTEEQRLIAPVVRAARLAGARVIGPVSPDAVFVSARHGDYDAVIAMYHDQGLIPLKVLARDEGVNVTLGLPYVRTAPDHGTAFDIAPRVRAHPGAMLAAIRLAITLAQRRVVKSTEVS